MSDWDKGPSTYVDKYRKPLGILLALISISIGLAFIDLWILPNRHIETQITAQTSFYKSTKGRKFFYSAIYETADGISFEIEQKGGWDGAVEIEYSPIFKTINKVYYSGENHSNYLISGFHNFQLFFIIALFVTTFIGAIVFLGNQFISENMFLNILLGTGFILFCFALIG